MEKDAMTSTSVLRLRQLLARHGPTVAVVLVVVGVVAVGGALWVFADPPTTEVTVQTNEQTIRSALETRSNVSGQTALYAAGTTLHNQPVYLQSITPTVTLVHRTTVPSDQSVHVRQRTDLVVEAVHGGAVFWRSNRTLGQTETTTQSGTVVTRSHLNITAVEQRLAQRQATIEGAGSLRVSLRTRVHYETGQYSGTFTKQAPLTLENDWYVIPTPSTTRTRQMTVQRTTTVPRDASSYLVPGAVGIVALLLGVGVAGAWRYRLRAIDPAELQHRIDRRVHADWISEGSLDNVDAERSVSVQTLEDLVDIAIDSDRRVIHDPEQDVFAVVDDAAVYYYDGAAETRWEWQGELFGQ